MGVYALTDCFSYVGPHDFTANSNNLQLNVETVALDATRFRQKWTVVTGGLRTGTLEMSGHWAAAPDTPGLTVVDEQAWNAVSANTTSVHTFGPDEESGHPAYFWQGAEFTYQLGGTVGELAPYTLSGQNTDKYGVLRGLLAKPWGEEDTSAVGPLGTAVQLGAGGAGTHLFASLHAFTAGTTVTVAIESDSTSAFTTPTTVATFPAVTAAGGFWLPPVDASGITDTWFRFNVTAITGAFSLAGAIAIK